jgi:hypothetical protein
MEISVKFAGTDSLGEQSIDLHGEVVKQVIGRFEKVMRDELIQLGWTPPPPANEVTIEVWQGCVCVASVNAATETEAMSEIAYYISAYEQDGPIEVVRVLRTSLYTTKQSP